MQETMTLRPVSPEFRSTGLKRFASGLKSAAQLEFVLRLYMVYDPLCPSADPTRERAEVDRFFNSCSARDLMDVYRALRAYDMKTVISVVREVIENRLDEMSIEDLRYYYDTI